MQNDSPKASRRRFFFAASATGAALAAAPLIKHGVSASVPAAVRAVPQRGGGYLLSEHIERYYKTARV